MARMAATTYAADWTFSCDGDEFWWPRGPSLKDVFAATPKDRGIVFAAVRNFVPVAGDEEDFWERMTLRFSPHAPVNDPVSPFRPYHPKVGHRADSTVVVHRGNHALPESRHLPVVGWYPIEVLHFPIRTVRQAKEKLVSWAQALGAQARGADVAAARAMGSGDVNTSVASYLLDEAAIQRGLRAGVLVEDLRLRERFAACSQLRRKDVASSFRVTIVGACGSSKAGRRCRSSGTWHPTTTRRCFESDGEWTTSRAGCPCSRRVCREARDVDRRERLARRRPGRAGVVPSERRRGRHSRRRRRHRRRRSICSQVPCLSRLRSPHIGHERSDGARAPHEPGAPRRDRARR